MDITSGLEIAGPKGRSSPKGVYWQFRDFDAILALSVKGGRVDQMSFWSKADFQQDKVHRAKTEQKIAALSLDTKTKKVMVEKVGQPPASNQSLPATNISHGLLQQPPQVITNFQNGASLSQAEVNEVILLARQCGIIQPGEVRTFYWLPVGGRGVAVKSVEQINEADITYDEIIIGKDGWTDIGPSGEVKRVGRFWAKSSDKSSTHLRMYDFRGERIRVRIGDGITTELADKVIPLIAAKKVRFPPEEGALDFQRREMKEMMGLKPSGLSKEFNGELWLHFADRWNTLQFRFEKGEVILEQVINISV